MKDDLDEIKLEFDRKQIIENNSRMSEGELEERKGSNPPEYTQLIASIVQTNVAGKTVAEVESLMDDSIQ